MKLLTNYIENKNSWNAIFGKAPMEFPLTDDNVKSLVDSLGCELSPENLHCDGEISRAEANRKYKYLTGVQAELEQYARDNGLICPEIIY